MRPVRALQLTNAMWVSLLWLVFAHLCVFCSTTSILKNNESILVLSIYFSGDPHQFEQKFNYRRPMYPILKYMWTKENYRESIKVTINKCDCCH